MKINPLRNREKKIAEYLNELKFERIKNKWDNSLDFFFPFKIFPVEKWSLNELTSRNKTEKQP